MDAVTVWFTNDESCIPVKIQLDLIIGSVQGHLIEYKQPEHDKTSLKTTVKLPSGLTD